MQAFARSDCGAGATDCRVGVFSAITPWAEAIVHDTAINRLSPSRKVRCPSGPRDSVTPWPYVALAL